jgi:hypothetical protein
MSLDDFPNEVLYHLLTFFTERGLIITLQVCRNFRALSDRLLVGAPLPTNYGAFVRYFQQEKWFSIKCAIDLNKLGVFNLARFEGYLQRPNLFGALESYNSGKSYNPISCYVAGLAEVGQFEEVEHLPTSDCVINHNYITEFPAAVLAGATRARDWELVSMVLKHLDSLGDRNRKWALDRGFITVDETLGIFLARGQKLSLFRRIKKRVDGSFRFSEMIVNYLRDAVSQPWTPKKSKWLRVIVNDLQRSHKQECLKIIWATIAAENYNMFAAMLSHFNICDIPMFIKHSESPELAAAFFAQFQNSGPSDYSDEVYDLYQETIDDEDDDCDDCDDYDNENR